MELKIKILLGLLVLAGLSFAYWVFDSDGGYAPFTGGICEGEGPGGYFAYEDTCNVTSNTLIEYFPNSRSSCGYEIVQCWTCIVHEGPDECEWIG